MKYRPAKLGDLAQAEGSGIEVAAQACPAVSGVTQMKRYENKSVQVKGFNDSAPRCKDVSAGLSISVLARTIEF